jgi:hypothetical protein
MKNGILIALIMMLCGYACADTPTTQTTPQPAKSGGFYLGLATGADLPGTNWDPTYYVGSMTDLLVGYGFDQNLGIQADLGQGIYTGNGTNLYQFRGLVDLKYTFNVVGWQPYLIAGAGTVFQSLSPSGVSTTNFDGQAGAGVQFDLLPKTHLFIEGKYNLILSQTTTFGDIPLTAGLLIGF